MVSTVKPKSKKKATVKSDKPAITVSKHVTKVTDILDMMNKYEREVYSDCRNSTESESCQTSVLYAINQFRETLQDLRNLALSYAKAFSCAVPKQEKA